MTAQPASPVHDRLQPAPPVQPDEGRAWLRPLLLAAFGTGLVIVYLTNLTLPFGLLELYPVSYLDLGNVTSYDPAWGVRLTAGFLVLFGLYVAAWVTARGDIGYTGKFAIVFFGLVFNLLLLLTHPLGAIDIYDYLAHARILTVYDGNPYVQTPGMFRDDPYFRFVGWWWLRMTYGPMWAILGAPAGILSEVRGLLPAVLYFKGLAIAFGLGSAWIIHRVLTRSGARFPWAGALLFLWSPLVVFEFAGSAHNDAPLVFFLLLSVLLLQARRTAGSFIALAAATVTKYVTAPLFAPLSLAVLRHEAADPLRRRLLAVATGTTLAAVLVILVYLPFWAGRESLGVLAQTDLFTATPAAVIARLLEGSWGWDRAAALARRLAILTFGVGFALVLVRLTAQRTPTASFVVAGYEALFLLVLVGLTWVKPWYVAWVLALAPLTGDVRREVRAVAMAIGNMMTYPVWMYLGPVQGEALTTFQLESIATAAAVLPPLLATLALHPPRPMRWFQAARDALPPAFSVRPAPTDG